MTTLLHILNMLFKIIIYLTSIKLEFHIQVLAFFFQKEPLVGIFIFMYHIYYVAYKKFKFVKNRFYAEQQLIPNQTLKIKRSSYYYYYTKKNPRTKKFVFLFICRCSNYTFFSIIVYNVPFDKKKILLYFSCNEFVYIENQSRT